MDDGFTQLDLKEALHIAEHMRRSDAECIRAMAGDFSANTFALNRWQTNGAAFAFYQDGIPVAMGGLAEANKWSAVAWFVACDGIRPESWKKLIRFSRKVFGNAALRYRRIEASCIETWPAAMKYAQKVGFKQYAERGNAGRDGETIYEYVILGKAE
jgi:hypothetical protein